MNKREIAKRLQMICWVYVALHVLRIHGIEMTEQKDNNNSIQESCMPLNTELTASFADSSVKSVGVAFLSKAENHGISDRVTSVPTAENLFQLEC